MSIADQLHTHLTTAIPSAKRERAQWVRTAALLMGKSTKLSETAWSTLAPAATAVPDDVMALILISQNGELEPTSAASRIIQSRPKTEQWLRAIIKSDLPQKTWPILGVVLDDVFSFSGTDSPATSDTWINLLSVLSQQSDTLGQGDGCIHRRIMTLLATIHATTTPSARAVIAQQMDSMCDALPNHRPNLWRWAIPYAPEWAIKHVDSVAGVDLAEGLSANLTTWRPHPLSENDVALAKILIAANPPEVCEAVTADWARYCSNDHNTAIIARLLVERVRSAAKPSEKNEEYLTKMLVLCQRDVVLGHLIPDVITPTPDLRKNLVSSVFLDPRDGVSVGCMRVVMRGMPKKEAEPTLVLMLRRCEETSPPWPNTINECVGLVWEDLAPASRRRLLTEHPYLLECPPVQATQNKKQLQRAVSRPTGLARAPKM